MDSQQPTEISPAITHQVADLTTSLPADIDAWTDCIKAIFGDLVALNDLDPEVFDELFYGRTNEMQDFCSSIDGVAKSGRNFLVVGEAGIGKSSFLYRIFLSREAGLRKDIYPIILDFRKGQTTKEAAQTYLIDKIEKYFDSVEYPIHTIKDAHKTESINYNLLKVSEHLTSYTPTRSHRHLLLMVDDLDYADDFWYEFLISINNLIVSPKISFILSIRPTLEFLIRDKDDVFYREMTRVPKRITLDEMSVSNILHKRLAPLIRENQLNPIHAFFKRVFRRDSSLCRILRKSYGITRLDQLARFDFPFTEKLIDFMAQITNGNNREVFDIAEAMLRFIFERADTLETRLENGEKRYVVPRSAIIEVFWTQRSKWRSAYSLFPLNEERSEEGNSLHYNVLEAVKYLGVLNRSAYLTLEKLGHGREEVDNSLQVLADRGRIRQIGGVLSYSPRLPYFLLLVSPHRSTSTARQRRHLRTPCRPCSG